MSTHNKCFCAEKKKNNYLIPCFIWSYEFFQQKSCSIFPVNFEVVMFNFYPYVKLLKVIFSCIITIM